MRSGGERNLRRKGTIDSFRYASEGILHCFRTQKHMRFHFAALVLALFLGLVEALDTRDMLVLLFCISLVIATEMVNTAVEALVDMVTPSYHPAAKLAKDVAAGAVLVASINAAVAGILILGGGMRIQAMRQHATRYVPDVTLVLVVGILIVALLVVTSKLMTGRSNAGLLRGGVVSGHSALGFFLAVTIIFAAGNWFISLLALLMALLIAQSRVEAGVHTLREVALGALVAIVVSSAVYWLAPYVRSKVAARTLTAVVLTASGTGADTRNPSTHADRTRH